MEIGVEFVRIAVGGKVVCKVRGVGIIYIIVVVGIIYIIIVGEIIGGKCSGCGAGRESRIHNSISVSNPISICVCPTAEAGHVRGRGPI